MPGAGFLSSTVVQKLWAIASLRFHHVGGSYLTASCQAPSQLQTHLVSREGCWWILLWPHPAWIRKRLVASDWGIEPPQSPWHFRLVKKRRIQMKSSNRKRNLTRGRMCSIGRIFTYDHQYVGCLRWHVQFQVKISVIISLIYTPEN